MLENKKKLDHENSPYHYVGKELGHDVYLVDIKENKTKKTEINLDDALLDSSDFSDEYYDCQWREEPPKNENDLNQNDFYRMEYKEIQYHIYRQLKNLSSLLSDIKEVVVNGNKAR